MFNKPSNNELKSSSSTITKGESVTRVSVSMPLPKTKEELLKKLSEILDKDLQYLSIDYNGIRYDEVTKTKIEETIEWFYNNEGRSI